AHAVTTPVLPHDAGVPFNEAVKHLERCANAHEGDWKLVSPVMLLVQAEEFSSLSRNGVAHCTTLLIVSLRQPQVPEGLCTGNERELRRSVEPCEVSSPQARMRL